MRFGFSLNFKILDCLIRNCFMNTRPFEMSIVDNTGIDISDFYKYEFITSDFIFLRIFYETLLYITEGKTNIDSKNPTLILRTQYTSFGVKLKKTLFND